MNILASGWKTSDFLPGQSWLRYNYETDSSYVYVNIPKNASSWAKENFGGYEYNFITQTFVGTPTSAVTIKRARNVEPTYVVILRDPLDRWLSGAAQSFYGCSPDSPYFFMNIHNDMMFQHMVFDNHTAPQTMFLQGINQANTVWFKCNDNLTYQLDAWMQECFNDTVSPVVRNNKNSYNVSAYGVGNEFLARDNKTKIIGWSQQEIIDELKNRLEQNPKYKQLIRDFYTDDYALYESVKFYDPR